MTTNFLEELESAITSPENEYQFTNGKGLYLHVKTVYFAQREYLLVGFTGTLHESGRVETTYISEEGMVNYVINYMKDYNVDSCDFYFNNII